MSPKRHSVPHIITAQAGPFYYLEKQIIQQATKIETWFRNIWQAQPPILTASVDLRNAGFKIAPIDTNLFPAGFNNLNPEFYPFCIQAIQSVLYERYPKCQQILIIAESHTRNQHYYQNLATLANLIQSAGYDVKLGSFIAETEPLVVNLEDRELVLYPITRREDKIICDQSTPCLILLNNDLSEGVPEILKGVKQPIDPHYLLGWSNRSKATHFHHYQSVCEEFSKVIGIDPWQISALFTDSDQINFVDKVGMETLCDKTSELLAQIQAKYTEHRIEHKPFVIIKADAGTYGMAVMTVRDPNELLNLNRKQRANMSMRKGQQPVSHYLLQEGVYTFETLDDDKAVAEPVIYMFGHFVLGGFYRVHARKGPDESLNSPGMRFKMLAFDQCCNHPNQRDSEHSSQNQFYVYSVIARLALYASSKELASLLGTPS